MNSNLKLILIIFLFFLMYHGSLLILTTHYIFSIYFYLVYIFLYVIWSIFLYQNIKNIKVYIFSILKIIFFSLFLILYAVVAQGFTGIILFGLDGPGYLERHNFHNYELGHGNVLYWLFIFSLHYPIYIFIFIKPFVNHLDKSIKKFKEKELNKDE
ncbi:hypothetical protein [Campylobacter sputorum]|uniref:hypothetical protein n=2 Tax=Campylobacter sputorum TaxID=206 RepID=UPI000B76C49C|nr:hypothetical protein [Campylobacter sputorum]ASM36866.1 hypothetical protein CSF_0998 [Campylobacter sputorum bv. faecalis CCUG 20703]